MISYSQLIASIEQLASHLGGLLQLRGFKPGGTEGQVPVKSSGEDFDWQWGDIDATNHGNLTGLGDDDHPQYLTNARGDVRYDAKGAAAAVEGRVTVTLNTKASVSTVNALTDVVSGKAALGHTHTIGNITGLQSALNTKASNADVSAFQNQVDAALVSLYTTVAGKSDTGHTHTISNVTGLQVALDDKASNADLTLLQNQVDTDVSNLSTEIQDKASAADLVSLSSAVDGKSNVGHTHNIEDVSGLGSTLDGKSDTGHTHSFDSLEDKPNTLLGYGVRDISLSTSSDNEEYEYLTVTSGVDGPEFTSQAVSMTFSAPEEVIVDSPLRVSETIRFGIDRHQLYWDATRGVRLEYGSGFGMGNGISINSDGTLSADGGFELGDPTGGGFKVSINGGGLATMTLGGEAIFLDGDLGLVRGNVLEALSATIPILEGDVSVTGTLEVPAQTLDNGNRVVTRSTGDVRYGRHFQSDSNPALTQTVANGDSWLRTSSNQLFERVDNQWVESSVAAGTPAILDAYLQRNGGSMVGQLQLSASQAATDANSAMTRGLHAGELLFGMPQVRPYPPTILSNSGTGSQAAVNVVGWRIDSGTAAASYGMANFSPIITQNGGINSVYPLAFSVWASYLLLDLSTTRRQAVRFVVGGPSVPTFADQDPLTGRGFGWEIYYDTANASLRLRAFAHNGTVITYGADVVAPGGGGTTATHIICESTGTGTINIYASSHVNSGSLARTPTTPIATCTGMATSGNIAGTIYLASVGHSTLTASLNVRTSLAAAAIKLH